MKARILFAGLGLAALAAAGFAPSPPDDPLDPIRVAGDTHHRHPHGMSVYFTDWDAKVTPDGRPPEVHHRKAGTFAWNEASSTAWRTPGTRKGTSFVSS